MHDQVHVGHSQEPFSGDESLSIHFLRYLHTQLLKTSIRHVRLLPTARKCFSVRVIGLFVKHYLFEENYSYTPFEIFHVVSYVLTVNLCFTLFKAVKTIAKDETVGGANARGKKEMVSATILAVLIGVITFLHGNNACGVNVCKRTY